MAEPPPKRRRALLDYVGNEIDHLEKENDELRREVERIRTDMAELKRLDGLRAKDIFDLNMQNRALEKKIRDKDVDLDEEKDAVRELWSQIEALKSQNSLPSEEKELVRELRQQNEVLARRNTLLVATMQEIREISQEGTPIKIYTSSEPSKNPSLKISAEKLWENRLGSLSLGLLGELLQSIYNQDFKSRLGITVVRDMIARVHRESKQQHMDASQKAAGENTKLSYRQPSIPDITRDRMADVLAKQLKRVVDTRENQHETFRKKNLEVLSEPNEVIGRRATMIGELGS